MTITAHLSSLVGASVLALATSFTAGCDDAPTRAFVDNGFAAAPDAGSTAAMTVYKVWWLTTLFADAVPAGATSETERPSPGSAFAYALLAPGWSPEDGGRPPRLVALESRGALSVSAHGVLSIAVSDDTFTGDCARGAPLGADDAALITERIFPGDFAGGSYDPATCVTTANDADAAAPAADAPPDGG
jgi:hypothetical protein